MFLQWQRKTVLLRCTCSCIHVDVLLLHYLAITWSHAMHCACVITQSMPSIGNKFVITPLLVQCLIYKHHALGLGACKSDIAPAGGVITYTCGSCSLGMLQKFAHWIALSVHQGVQPEAKTIACIVRVQISVVLNFRVLGEMASMLNFHGCKFSRM